MQVAQQSGDVWDYVKGSPSWGGHATVWGGFPGSPDDIDTVSWGAVYEMTQAFVQHQVTEAYVIVTQAHVDHAAFREGFDLVKFGEAFTQLTGRPFPVVIPNPVPHLTLYQHLRSLYQSLRTWIRSWLTRLKRG